MLAVVLLLPLTAAGQDTPEALTAPDRDEAVEALAVTAPREGDPTPASVAMAECLPISVELRLPMHWLSRLTGKS